MPAKSEYRIVFRSSAEKQLQKLPKIYYQRVKKKVLNLSANPFPPGYEKLKGGEKLKGLGLAIIE